MGETAAEEPSEEEQPEPKDWGSPWVWSGGALTLLWLIALGWHIWFNHPGGLIEAPNALPQDLNNLGDFLAGAFAPLALLWLFIAVMVQAKELSLQRKELRLTRQEFKENRKVAKMQAEEYARHTQLLRDEAGDRRQGRAQDDLQAETVSLRGWIGRQGILANYRLSKGQSITVSFGDAPEDEQQALAFVCTRLIEAGRHVDAARKDGKIETDDDVQWGAKTAVKQHALNELKGRLARIEALTSIISGDHEMLASPDIVRKAISAIGILQEA